MQNATIVAEELVKFLAIKRCEGTKIGKVIKGSLSSTCKLVHICATRVKAVKKGKVNGKHCIEVTSSKYHAVVMAQYSTVLSA